MTGLSGTQQWSRFCSSCLVSEESRLLRAFSQFLICVYTLYTLLSACKLSWPYRRALWS